MVADMSGESAQKDARGRMAVALTLRELADLGISRAELQEMVASPRALPQRVDRAANAFGLTHEMVARDRRAYAEVMCVCATCSASPDCEADVEVGAPGTRQDLSFCPNGPQFRELLALS
jgi:hypothetical protein